MGFSEEDKKQLVHIVKRAIENKIEKKSNMTSETTSQSLKEKKGVFVTLRKKGGLRGCIGSIEAGKPLYRLVEEMAVAASFNDQRFAPLERSELKDITIEISVLSPLKKISEIEEIQVGVHGLYIKKGYHSGLLLPQVANAYGWDRLTFLEEVCFKAGLPPNDWNDKNTSIFIFSAEIFEQKW